MSATAMPFMCLFLGFTVYSLGNQLS